MTRRLRTPTTDEWRDGRFIDAGQAMVLASNLAHLQRESVRHLVTSLGPGSITNALRGYTYIASPLFDAPDPGSYSGLTNIAWDLQTSTLFGPFIMVNDREVSGQAPTWRKIRVNVDCTGSALSLFAALTYPGSQPDEHNLGFASATVSAGRTTPVLTIEPIRSVRTQPTTARRPDGAVVESSQTCPMSLWVGWYSASGSSAIYSITADEIR